MNRNCLRILRGAALALSLGFTLSAQSQSISQWDGGTNGTGTSWATSANWAGDTLPTNASNTIVRVEDASADGTIGGSSSFMSISANRTLGTIVFSNINGKLPSSLNIDANQSGTTTSRTITLHSGITLENSTTTVAFRGNNGTLSIALGANNTFHVADLGAQLSILNNINVSGDHSVEKTGDGTLLMGTGSTFTGGLILTSGRLRTNGSTVASGGAVTNGAFGLGTLTLRGGILQSFSATTRVYHNSVHIDGNVTLGGFAPDGTTLTGRQTFSTVGGGSTTVTGQRVLDVQSEVLWNQTIGGSGGIVKTGNALLTLAGSNTYSGLTTVSAGTLELTGSLAGGLDIASGALFTGAGTVGGAATIAGTHNPGNSPGIQSFGSDLTYHTGATVNWELNANTATQGDPAVFDQVIVGGTLDFAGATLLNLSFNGAGSTVNWADEFWATNHSWQVYDAAALANFDNLGLVPADWLDSNGVAFSTLLSGATFSLALDGSDVLLSYTAAAIPEPSTYAALFGALALGLVAYRRRRAATPAA